jgi:hypothetical protein
MRVVVCRYVSHADSEPRGYVSAVNSDRPPAAVEVLMEEYSLSQRAEDDADASRQVVQAALEVLRWYQARLLEFEPGPVDELRAWELTRKRDWALHALIRYKGGDKGWAKQQQLEITADRPLAICTGGGSGIPVKTELGKRRLVTHTRGCFVVFEEKTNVAGKKWPRLCPRCRQRNPYRTAERL